MSDQWSQVKQPQRYTIGVSSGVQIYSGTTIDRYMQTVLSGIRIESYISQNMLQSITSSENLDPDRDSYVAGLEQLGLPRYVEVMQQAYDVLPKSNRWSLVHHQRDFGRTRET